jgi:hypothetical protein
MCQYLYAAFSLKLDADEGLTDAQAAAVARWRRVLGDICIDEMLHLALVANVMAAIGAAPTVSRPNFPQRTMAGFSTCGPSTASCSTSPTRHSCSC